MPIKSRRKNMIRIVRFCSILLMVVSILVYGGLILSSLAAKKANASGSLDAKSEITVIDAAVIQN